MQFALIVLALQSTISIAQGQGRLDLGSFGIRNSFPDINQRIDEARKSISTSTSTSISTSTTSSTTTSTVSSPEIPIEIKIVDTISLGDVDGISDAIKGVDSVDVGSAFVIATESDANLQNLGLFVLAVVSNVPADVQTVNATVDAFKIMAEKQYCEQIFLVFSVIEELVENDERLTANLLSAFSDASNVLLCAFKAALIYSPPPPFPSPTSPTSPFNTRTAIIQSAPVAASASAAAAVSFQELCYEGSQPCSWWEKKYRSLLNEDSQCVQRYVCSYFGYDTIAQCNKWC